MKPFAVLKLIAATAILSTSALADSRDYPLPEKIRHCAIVAEIRIDSVRLQRDPADKFEDLVCECTVLQGFKLPFATNRLILRLNFAAPRDKYEQKKALVFASDHKGHFRPYGGKAGLILEDETYNDRYSRKQVKCTELIRDVKAIVEANKPMQPAPR